MAAALTCPKCKKTLRTANPMPPGKKVKCPSCESVFVVPGAKAAPPAETAVKKPTKPAPAKSPPPAKAPPAKPPQGAIKKPAAAAPTAKGRPTAPPPRGKAPPAPVGKNGRKPVIEPDEDLDDLDTDMDEADEDERPARRGAKKPKRGGNKLLLLVGVGVLLIAAAGVAAFVYPGFLNAPTVQPRKTAIAINGDPKNDENKIGNPPLQGPSTSALLAYLPANTAYIGGVRPKAPLIRKLLDKFYKDAFGTDPKSIPEPELILAGGTDIYGMFIIQTAQPFDRKVILELSKAKPLPGKDYFGAPDGRGFLAMPSDHVIVVGGGKWAEDDFAAAVVAKEPRLNASLLAQATAMENFTLWGVAANNADIKVKLGEFPPDMIAMLEPQIPGVTEAHAAAMRAKFVRVGVNLPATGGVDLQLSLVCVDEKDAKKVSDLGNDFWQKQGQGYLQLAKIGAAQSKIDLGNLTEDIAQSFKLGSNADVLTAAVQISDSTVKALEKLPFLDENAALAVTHANNLKQLAIAMHSYHDTFRKFPPASTYDQEGKPLLSWRVHILPFIEQQELYQQFDLNAPWDDPKNLALLKQMPKVYEKPGRTAMPGSTFYQVFVADETEPVASSPIFRLSKDHAATFLNVADGTSNTILVAEADSAVPWTKPDDLRYSAKLPVPKLGDPLSPTVSVVMADGSVVRLKRPVDDNNLRRAITANDGQGPTPDWADGGKAEALPVVPKVEPPKTTLPEEKKEPPAPKADPMEPKVPEEVKKDPPEAVYDLKMPLIYMPAFTDTVVGMNFDTFKTSPVTAPLFDLFRAQVEKSDKAARNFVSEWQYVCVGGTTESTRGVLYIQTKSPLTDDDLKKNVTVLNAREQLGMNYYEIEIANEKAWIARLDQNHILLGWVTEAEFSDLLIPGAGRLDADLRARSEKFAAATAWGVTANRGPIKLALMSLKPEMLENVAPELAPLIPVLQGVRFFQTSCRVRDNLADFNLDVVLADGTEADMVRGKIDEFWKTKGKLFLGAAGGAVPGVNTAGLVDEISKTLQFKTDKDVVSASVTLSKATLDELQKAAAGFIPGPPKSLPASKGDPLPIVPPRMDPIPNPNNPGGDMVKLQGKWKLISQSSQGKMAPGAATYTIDGSKLIGMGPIAMEMRLDDTRVPKLIDFSVTQNGNTFVYQGIYTLNDTEFKFCVAPPGMERPGELDAPRNRPSMLFITERLKE